MTYNAERTKRAVATIYLTEAGETNGDTSDGREDGEREREREGEGESVVIPKTLYDMP